MRGAVIQPIGMLRHLFNVPFVGAFPASVDQLEFCYWFARAGEMECDLSIAETFEDSEYGDSFQVKHGTTTQIFGTVDETNACSSEPNLFRPAGGAAADYAKAVWNFSYQDSHEGTGGTDPTVGLSLGFGLLNGLGWSGTGDLSMQFGMSGTYQVLDSTFPFSTRQEDFVNPTGILLEASITGVDLINGRVYHYPNIGFFEELGTDSGLNGSIDLTVNNWFEWRDEQGLPLYRSNTGGYA